MTPDNTPAEKPNRAVRSWAISNPFLLSSVTALLLLLVPIGYWANANDSSAHDVEHEVKHAAERLDSLLSTRLRSIELVLKGVRGFVEGSDAVTAEEFQTFIDSLNTRTNARGIVTVSYIFREADERTQSAQVALGSLPPSVGETVSRFGRFTAVPSPLPRTGHTGDLAESRRDMEERALFHSAALWDAAARARRTGVASISSRIRSTDVGHEDDPTYVAMYVPISSAPKEDGLSPEHVRGFVGWAEATISLHDILEADEALIEPGIAVQLYDGVEQTKDSFLIGWLNGQRSELGERASRVNQRITGVLNAQGRQWTYVVTPSKSFVQEHTRSGHHLVAVLGLLLSLAGSAIVWLLTASRAQALSSSAEKTKELQLLHKAVASLNDMLLITKAEPFEEPGPEIVFANKAMETATGYSISEILGKTPRIFQGPGTSAQEARRIGEALRAWQPIVVEILNYKKDGTPYWVELNIQPIADETGWYTHWVSVQRDITDRRINQDKIYRLAFFDELTKLPNRSMFLSEATRLLAEESQNKQITGVLLIDLDNFKVINDIWGHQRGDELLIQMAERLKKVLCPEDLLFRVGGDEFAVLLWNVNTQESTIFLRIERLCKAILETLSQPVILAKNEHFISASIGALTLEESGVTTEGLLSRVDSALHSAKKVRGNSFKFFDMDLMVRIAEKTSLENDLRLSIQRKEIYLAYQPQVNDQGNMVGVEALCRWNHTVKGHIPPSLFIPLAEETGFMQVLGAWVLENACKFLRSWDQTPGMTTMVMSVNVSAQQFHHPAFVQQVIDVVTRTGIDASRLKMELTESIFVENIDDVVEKMNHLKSLGIKFSLDDFGTGYSSLSYLKKLPLDQLKIDQSFVRDALRNSHDESIARTIIALGSDLGLQVIGEGVENTEQLDFLRNHGCRFFQGYLFGKPMTDSDLISKVDLSQL